jgi:hypothetical protein
MRSFVINKIIAIQYPLGKLIGKKGAKRVSIFFEKGFTILFGREVYHDKD